MISSVFVVFVCCRFKSHVVRRNIMLMGSADKQAFVNALDQAKRTIHPDIVICTRRCVLIIIVFLLLSFLNAMFMNNLKNQPLNC